MKSINGDFYRSKVWRETRERFLELYPFCEECLKNKRYTPATLVHHRVHLNEKNINNPKISLDFSNLEAVCLECHNTIHMRKVGRRYTVGSDGKVQGIKDIPPVQTDM